MASLYVLDASAILAVVNNESGQDVVRSLILRSTVSTVTIAEVYTKLAEWGRTGEQMVDELLFAVEEIIPFTTDQAISCGTLRTSTRVAGLSLGDRACVALAAMLDAEAVTSDRAWAKLPLPCTVRLFR